MRTREARKKQADLEKGAYTQYTFSSFAMLGKNLTTMMTDEICNMLTRSFGNRIKKTLNLYSAVYFE